MRRLADLQVAVLPQVDHFAPVRILSAAELDLERYLVRDTFSMRVPVQTSRFAPRPFIVLASEHRVERCCFVPMQLWQCAHGTAASGACRRAPTPF